MAKIRPIVFLVDEPTDLVLNAYNSTISNNTANWEGPEYPLYCNLGGKTAQLTVYEAIEVSSLALFYSKELGSSAAPEAGRFQASQQSILTPGTYTITLNNNQATPAQGQYGKYLTLFRYGPVTTIDSSFLSKFEIRILNYKDN